VLGGQVGGERTRPHKHLYCKRFLKSRLPSSLLITPRPPAALSLSSPASLSDVVAASLLMRAVCL
jgi:hypothetical protein